jgi:hypothetical protein
MKSRIASFLTAGLTAATIALGAGTALADRYPTTTDEARALAGKQVASRPDAASESRPADDRYPTTTDEARAQVARRQPDVAVVTATPRRVAQQATTTDQARGLY